MKKAEGRPRTWLVGGSLTPRILKMYAEGISQRKISQTLGCSETNVNQAIRREKARLEGKPMPNVVVTRPWAGRIAPLVTDHVAWLEAEAKRAGTTPDVIARSLLVDAIENEIGEANVVDSGNSLQCAAAAGEG